MLWGASEQSELFTRIDHWKQEVVENTLQRTPTQARSQQYEAHHMKLRSRDTRPALAEVSRNHCSRKRKASPAMADAPSRKYGKKAAMDENVEESTRRPGRGRPPKHRQVDAGEEFEEQSASYHQGRSANIAESATSYESSLPSRNKFPPPETPRRDSSSPSKGNRSPSKRGQITFDRLVPEAAIDMKYLSRCDPAVHLTNFRKLKQAQKGIPSLVGDLHHQLEDIPLGLIPFALEVCFPLFERQEVPKLAYPSSAPIPTRCQHPTQVQEAAFEIILLRTRKNAVPGRPLKSYEEYRG